MHQMLLAYMAVFRQVSLENGPSGPELSALPTGPQMPVSFLGQTFKTEILIDLYVLASAESENHFIV